MLWVQLYATATFSQNERSAISNLRSAYGGLVFIHVKTTGESERSDLDNQPYLFVRDIGDVLR